MPTPLGWIAIVLWTSCLVAAAMVIAQRLSQRSKMQRRLFDDLHGAADPLPAEDAQNWLARWLFLAGYRSRRATMTFLIASAACAVLGVALAMIFFSAGTVEQLAAMAIMLPGGVGEVSLPLIYGSPWIAWVVFASLPTMAVRAARRRRVQQVEEDLPLVLDLLATLAEAGLGFDAAVDQVLTTIEADRTLPQELRAFQRDVLAGRPRIESLRWLGRRIGVTWFSIFISAVVQAEQIGAGLSEVLKAQAEDLRQRRKEQALAFAMATPVKLLVPLVICFMPGILLSALGPAFFEIFRVLDNVTRPMQGR